jgi:hypothetical protein
MLIRIISATHIGTSVYLIMTFRFDNKSQVSYTLKNSFEISDEYTNTQTDKHADRKTDR